VNHVGKTRRPFSSKRKRQQEGGYAIMLVLLLATLMFIAAMAVAPNVKNQLRREREAELEWRGKQYIRGIKMYYRKTGKFPTSLEDLTKPKIGNIRFMRQRYKDPMNGKDGEWRLIYVGPAGQLIGSLKSRRALQLTGFGGFQNLTGPNIGGSGLTGGQQPFGQNFGQPFGQAANQSGAGLTAGGMQNPQSQLGAVSADTNEPGGLNSSGSADTDAADDEARLNSEPPTIMGGNIIGVGSKINFPSLKVYDKAKNYRQWEFIWDPSKDVMTVGSAPPAGSTPLGQQPQQGPFSQQGPASPNTPANPNPMPPETTPDQPQPEP
jgi:type II secretory pathway pseudopilin PulG